MGELIDDFLNQIFSNPPGEKNSIILENLIDNKPKEDDPGFEPMTPVGIFKTFLNIMIYGIKFQYGVISLIDLRDEDIEKINAYMNMFGVKVIYTRKMIDQIPFPRFDCPTRSTLLNTNNPSNFTEIKYVFRDFFSTSYMEHYFQFEPIFEKNVE